MNQINQTNELTVWGLIPHDMQRKLTSSLSGIAGRDEAKEVRPDERRKARC
jgi:hypothetical protein